MLNIYKIIHNSSIYGPGKRDVIWFRGCSLRCNNCINKNLWNRDAHSYLSVKDVSDKLYPENDVTLLGGEPLEQDDILEFIMELKKKNKGIILFTGYEIKELDSYQLQALKLCDVAITGRYVESKKDDSLYLRGSTNQLVIFNSERYDKSLFNKSNEFEIKIGESIESRGRSKNFLNYLLDLN